MDWRRSGFGRSPHLVDDEQIERERGEVLLVTDARAAEGIMGFPILRYAG